MTLFEWLLVTGFLAAAVWFWSFLYRGEKRAFHCVGCGKCVAAGECVLMREERERQMKKAAAKNAEKPGEPS